MIVNGEGDLKAKIWLIGEAPGDNEDKQGRPFVGGAGLILNSILAEVGIKREDCYIDNVIQTRPPGNNFDIYYKDKQRHVPMEILLEAHKRVQELVQKHKPNVVVALGGEALYALVGKKAILNWRGSILGCHGVKVIPTVHPAMVMRQWEWHPVAVLDFNRIKEEAKTPQFPNAYLDNLIINPSFETCLQTLELLNKQEYVSFDIETASGIIACIGFAWSKEDAICIPFRFVDTSYWTVEEELTLIIKIKELLASKTVKFIAQNAQYDMVWLADKWDIKVPNLWLDTMVGFHCVYPELKKGLGFLSSIYTKRPFHKDSGKGGANNLWTYNCLDTVVTWECAMEIYKELQEFGTLQFYKENSHKIIQPLIDIQRKGIKIDTIKRQEVDINLQKDLEEMKLRLNTVVGHELNPLSPKQMKDFLYTELKLPPKRSRATGNLTADEDALEELAARFPNPVFKLVLDIRGVTKLLSTYIRAPLDNDGRIRCNYVITGTKTGRLSARESVYQTGTNLQNIPRGDIVRSIFIPDEGKVFINADLSQAEARVVAYIAKEERLQALFERQGDIHKYNAAMVFGKRLEEVTGEERQLAKTLVHAANYGIGPRKFSSIIGMSEAKASGLLNQYFVLYPRIKIWHMEVEARLRKSRILETPLGRKRMFFGRWSPDLVREAISYVPQSTVSDILNQGIIRAYPNLPQGWDILMQVHDSILMQVPVETDNMHIYKFIKHYFELWIDLDRTRFQIPVDIKIGKNWACLEKLEV